MKPSRPFFLLGAVCRFYSRPLRHCLGSHRAHGQNLQLGPVELPEHRLVLRSPRLSDFSAWQFLRLRDQHLIEPFWVSSSRSWVERHTERAWVDELLHMRKGARTGRTLPLVIEVDGRFAGQLNLEHVDSWARSAEMGIWLDSACGRTGITAAAGNLLGEHVFGTLGLRRITAPVCVDNWHAAHSAAQFGLRREGTMASYLDVGGRRKDHDLWAITSEMWAARAGEGSLPVVP